MRRFNTMYSAVSPMNKRVVSQSHTGCSSFSELIRTYKVRGLGGTLIRPVLEIADGEGRNCFLESANERNLSFYRRHGFEVMEEVQVPNGPRIWGMLRRPSR